MKTNLFWGLASVIMLFPSCFQQETVEEVMKANKTSLTFSVARGISSSSTIVSEDDAVYVASCFMKRNLQATRSIFPQVESLIHDNQTIGYVVNYPEGGFCIVASSKNAYPILAYSNKGKFSVSDIGNSGVLVWLDAYTLSWKNLSDEEKKLNQMHWDEYERPLVYPTVMSDQEKAAIFNQRLMELNEEFGGKGDARPLIVFRGSSFMSESLYEMFKSKGGSEEFTIVVCEREDRGVKIPAMISTEWHQYKPFGKYTKYGIAGCTVIAASQIMNYYKFPTYYDWNAMPINDYDNPTLCQFILDVCNKFDVEYKPTGTSSDINKIKKGLEEFGYRVEKKEGSHPALIREIRRPIYERGESKEGEGHAWIVDGYNEVDVMYYFTVEYLRGSSGSYYYQRDATRYVGGDSNPAVVATKHYNWGWADDGPALNGWYYSPELFPDDLKQLIITPSN